MWQAMSKNYIENLLKCFRPKWGLYGQRGNPLFWENIWYLGRWNSVGTRSRNSELQKCPWFHSYDVGKPHTERYEYRSSSFIHSLKRCTLMSMPSLVAFIFHWRDDSGSAGSCDRCRESPQMSVRSVQLLHSGGSWSKDQSQSICQ